MGKILYGEHAGQDEAAVYGSVGQGATTPVNGNVTGDSSVGASGSGQTVNKLLEMTGHRAEDTSFVDNASDYADVSAAASKFKDEAMANQGKSADETWKDYSLAQAGIQEQPQEQAPEIQVQTRKPSEIRKDMDETSAMLNTHADPNGNPITHQQFTNLQTKMQGLEKELQQATKTYALSDEDVAKNTDTVNELTRVLEEQNGRMNSINAKYDDLMSDPKISQAKDTVNELLKIYENGGTITDEDVTAYKEASAYLSDIRKQQSILIAASKQLEKSMNENRDRGIAAQEALDENELTGGSRWELVHGVLEQGSGQVVSGVTGFLNMTLGGFAEELHTMLETTVDRDLGDNLITRLDNYVKETQAKDAAYYGKNAEKLGKGAEAADKYGTMVAAAIPAAVIAYMTAGGSAMGTTAGLTSYAASMESSTPLLGQISASAVEMLRSPNFQTSFVQESGNAYREALNEGATDSEAAVYSLLYGFGSATIEVGGGDEGLGGIQKLPTQLQEMIAAGDRSGLLKYAKSIVSEMGEEVTQGMLEQGLKSMYRDDMKVFGIGDNAIIDPERMKEEALGAGLVSAVLGGGQIMASDIPIAIAQGENNANSSVSEGVAETRQNIPQETQTFENTPSGEFNSNVEGNGGKNPLGRDFGGDMAKTQDRVFETNLTEEERQMAGLGETEHEVHHDETVLQMAQDEITQNREAAAERVFSKAETWDDVDTAVAGRLIQDDVNALNEAIANGDTDAVNRIAQELADKKAKWNERGTEEAQALRQRRNFVQGAAETISDAAQTLEKLGQKGERKAKRVLDKIGKAQVLENVSDTSTRLDAIEEGDAESLIDLILDVSKIRGTDSGKGVRAALEQAATYEDGYTFLHNVCETQIKSIAGDYINPGWINQLKSIRFMNLLSNFATTGRNVGANSVYGGFIEASSTNLGAIADTVMSAFTGQRSLATDFGQLSKTKWQGNIEGGVKSFIEVTLDAEAEAHSYAYEGINGSTFKMVGNGVERFLARCAQLQGYALKTTDQIAKGGTEAITEKNLNRLAERAQRRGKETQLTSDKITEIAQDEAKHRTLQQESWISDKLTKARNEFLGLGIGNDRIGRYTIGEDILPFAQVPANSVVGMLEMNPISGSVISAVNLAQVISEAANGGVDIKTQRAFSQSIGRLGNGILLTLAAMGLRGAGLIRDTDDEDKDVKRMHDKQGLSGLQWNVSATLRIAEGKGTEPQDDDTYISLAWIPQLNSLMTMGCALWDSRNEDGHLDALETGMATINGIKNALMEFPAVSTITSMITAGQYADYEEVTVDEDATPAEKKAAEDQTNWNRFVAQAGAVAGDKLGNTVIGLTTPNILRAVSTGLDDTERDLYSSNNPFQRALDSEKAALPFLRETLPEKLDEFGHPIENGGGINNFMNRVINPGKITQTNISSVEKRLEEIRTATGNDNVVPPRNAPFSIKATDGDNMILTPQERYTYQSERGRLTEILYQSAFADDYFNSLDGNTQGRILEAYQQYADDVMKVKYAEAHGKEVKNTNSLLVSGEDKPGYSNDRDPIAAKDIYQYITFETATKDAIRKRDFGAIDTAVTQYVRLPADVQKAVDQRDQSGYRNYAAAASVGVGSETFTKFKDAVGDAQIDLNNSSESSGLVQIQALYDCGISSSDFGKLMSEEMDGITHVQTQRYMYNAVEAALGRTPTKDQFFDIYLSTMTGTNDKGDLEGVSVNGATLVDAARYFFPDDAEAQARFFNSYYIDGAGNKKTYAEYTGGRKSEYSKNKDKSKFHAPKK